MRTYGFGEVVALTGASRSQLIHWTSADTRLITAGVHNVPGTGHHRVFSHRDVVDVAIAVVLARSGLSVKRMGVVLRGLARHRRKAMRAPDALLFISGDPATPTAFWVGSRQEFIAELGGDGLLTVFTGVLIDLGQILRALEEATGESVTTPITPRRGSR